jgi:uncharacterized protein (TIGR00251 family)
MITVTPHAEGCVLSVRAQPGTRKAGVLGVHAGALKLAVTAPADQGRANEALVELLRELLGVRRSAVELLSGATSRGKRFLIRGLAPADVRERLLSHLARRPGAGDPQES